MWLFYKLHKIKKFSFSDTTAMLPMCNSPLDLLAAILDSADIEYSIFAESSIGEHWKQGTTQQGAAGGPPASAQ